MNIPNEILSMIIDYVGYRKDMQTLAACSRVCWRWRVETLPLLWQSRAIYHGSEEIFTANQLKYLRYLRNLFIACHDIDWNGLAADVMRSGKLKRLLFTRKFDHGDADLIAPLLRSLSQLNEVGFDNCDIVCDVVDLLASVIIHSGDGLNSISLRRSKLMINFRSFDTSALDMDRLMRKSLSHVEFSNMSSLTDSVLMELFTLPPFKSIKSLSLENTCISDWSICEILPKLKSLTHLNLTHTLVSNETLNCLLRNEIAPQLVTLKLGDSRRPVKNFDSLLVEQLIDNMTNAVVLHVGGCEISADCVERFLRSHPHVQELDVSFSQVTQETFGRISNLKFLHLKYLGLAGCASLTLECDRGTKTMLTPLSNFIFSNTLIEHLDLSGALNLKNAYYYGFRERAHKHSIRYWTPECESEFDREALKRLRKHMDKIIISAGARCKL